MICCCTHDESVHAKRGARECLYCDPKTAKFCKCKKLTLKEKNEMATAKKERKVKAAKLRRVIRFEIGKKPPLEKYLDEKNTAYSALMYRSIKEQGTPTFAEIFDDIKRSVANKTEGNTPKATLSVILAKMVKDGYVARSEAKEEAKAVAA